MKFKKSISALTALCILTGGCLTPAAFAVDSSAPAQVTMYGDATMDGKVDVSDAVLVARFATADNNAVITDTGKLNADVNLDGSTNGEDVTQILEFIAKKRTYLGKEDTNSAKSYQKYCLTDSVTAQQTESAPVDEAFVKSQYDLAASLMKQVSFREQEHDNILLSPLSLAVALEMAANGADGETAAELTKLLGGDISPELMNRYFKDYLENLPENDKAKLHLANSLWNSEVLNIKDEYLQTIKNYYGDTDVFKAPFTDETKDLINAWISDQTEGQIVEMLKYMNGNAVTYLINALAFDAEWENAWAETVKGEFSDYNTEKQTVDMLSGTEKYYISDKYAEGFIKEYAGGTYSFVGILPRESMSVTLSDYIGMLSGETIQKLLDSRTEEPVEVTMPKFSYSYDTLMNEPLQALGVKKAFSGDEADFSKLYAEGSEGTYISRVLHNTFIDVNEKGTQAAAATVIEIVRKGGGPAKLNFNRPFIYMIIDERTKLPVFIGSVKNPQADAAEQQQLPELNPFEVRFTVVDDKTGELIPIDENSPLSISTDISYDTPDGPVGTGPIIVLTENGQIEPEIGIGRHFSADHFSMSVDDYYLEKYHASGKSISWVKHDNGSYDVTVKLQDLGELQPNDVRFIVVDSYTGELIPLDEQNMMIVESAPAQTDIVKDQLITSPVFGMKENPAVESSGTFARLCGAENVVLTLHNTSLPKGYKLIENSSPYIKKNSNGSYDVKFWLMPEEPIA